MNKVLIATASENKLQDAKNEILNRSLLYEKTNKKLYVKYADELTLLNTIIEPVQIQAGSNIEVTQGTATVKSTVSLLDDIDINTCTLSPDQIPINWKGSIKLGELFNKNRILLLMKVTDPKDNIHAIIGGEILVRLEVSSQKSVYASYQLSMTSTGSWSLTGATETINRVQVCRCTYENNSYYGLIFPEVQISSSEKVIPDKVDVWFNGWCDIPTQLQIQNYHDVTITWKPLPDHSTNDRFYTNVLHFTVDQAPIQIPMLPETSETGNPYKCIITGQLTLSILKAIAAACKNSRRQVCLDLSKCTIDNTLNEWKTPFFENCSGLQTLIIPPGVQKITSQCFFGCTYLQHVDLKSAGTELTTLGMGYKPGNQIGLFTGTQVKTLIIPAKVCFFENYITGNSELEQVILLHEQTTVATLQQWTFLIHDVEGHLQDRTSPNYKIFVTKSWYDSYMTTTWIRKKTMWNTSTGWWTPNQVQNLVTYVPTWSQAEWQLFCDTHKWSESLVNEVRLRFGLTDPIEINNI